MTIDDIDRASNASNRFPLDDFGSVHEFRQCLVSAERLLPAAGVALIDDDEIVEDMRLVFEAEKNAGEPTGWAIGSHPGSLRMGLPLEIHASTFGTARLAFRAVERVPEADASITLIVTIRGRDLLAWRMDWRPLHTHTNRCGPKELRGLISNTGIHDFDCNARLGLTKMQADLPLCIPVDDEPHDFDAFVRYAFRKLRVSPTERILGPPWSPTLF